MNSPINRPIFAWIHSEAFSHNLTRVRELVPNSKIWSVVKANAYGHGFESALKGLADTDGFALLDLQDARWLRSSGWEGRILLLEGLFHPSELEDVLRLNCDLVVHCENQVSWLESLQTKSLKPIQIYLKLNSGMNRLGFKPSAYRTAFHRLHSAGHEIHHMSHFANADQIDKYPTVGQQLDCFSEAIEGLHGEICLANSAAILWHRNTSGNWVRPGIMLYGASPTGNFDDIRHAHLEAVMHLKSEIIDIQPVSAGDHIGYGGRFTAPEAMRIGIIACGYADGYPRQAKDGTPVWLEVPGIEKKGVICPLAGQVAMDMLTVDLRNAPQAKIGTKVELWGKQVPVDDVARMSGTIGYELLCGLAPRVPVLLK